MGGCTRLIGLRRFTQVPFQLLDGYKDDRRVTLHGLYILQHTRSAKMSGGRLAIRTSRVTNKRHER